VNLYLSVLVVAIGLSALVFPEIRILSSLKRDKRAKRKIKRQLKQAERQEAWVRQSTSRSE